MNDSLLFAWTLGGPEIILLFLVILLLFGAKKLPELARGLGKAKSEFQKASDEAEKEIKQVDPTQPTEKKAEDSTPPPGNN
jgi:sec-independent protein translocase protein TatA